MKRVFAITAAALALMCVAVGCRAVDDVESKAESVVSEAKDMVSDVISEGKDMISDAMNGSDGMVSDTKSNME